MTERIDNPPPGDDPSLGELLREVGARDMPSAAAMNDVREVVRGEWLAVVAQRQRRNRFVGYSVAAGVVAAVVAVAVSFYLAAGPGQPVAEVARVEGALQMAVHGSDEWRAAAQGAPLAAGTMLRTDEGTRVALNLPNGVSVRIDAGSLLELQAADHIALDRGAIYVDADPRLQATQQPGSQPLVVETVYGLVRHLGTQYELRTLRTGIEVSVREGRVEIANAGEKYMGTAGERLVIPSQGLIERAGVSTQDPRWQWATSIAPVFDIERRPLSQFLDWAARETGKQITYATPEVRARAEQLILRGSVSNLPPEQALAAVLATTPFTQSQTEAAIRIQL